MQVGVHLRQTFVRRRQSDPLIWPYDSIHERRRAAVVQERNRAGAHEKRISDCCLALAFLAASIPVLADYNKDVTVKAMRENYAGLTKAKTAANSDFFAAADGLMTIAKNA
jgi:hypothetical protein